MLDNLRPAEKIQSKSKYKPGIEFDGSEGTAVTPGYDSEPENFDEFLIDAGLDPAGIEVIPPVRTSRWQQQKDGELIWLTSYRFTFRKTNAGNNLDLPTLFAEAKKTKKPSIKTRHTDKAFIVIPADWQVGKVASRGGTKELMERLFASFDKIEAQMKAGKYERIVIIDAGDIIESVSNKANFEQLASNDLSPMQQVDLAAAMMWELIKRAAKYAPVSYGSVASNHCQNRFNGQTVGKPGLDDWGIVILQQLRRLATEVGLDVTFYIPHPEDEGFCLDVFGDEFHILGCWHGHQSGNPDRVPDYWRNQTFGSQYLTAASIAITGHFHHTRVQELGQHTNGGSRWWIQASTSDSGSDWFRRSSGEDSATGINCFELEKGKHFTGTVYKL